MHFGCSSPLVVEGGFSSREVIVADGAGAGALTGDGRRERGWEPGEERCLTRDGIGVY